MNFLRLPIDRPVTTIMLFWAVTIFGIISWTRLPQQLFPSLEYPQISIITRYEGAGPEESEKLISKIIEESVGTVKNVTRIRSVSREGVSIVSCEFKWGTDMNFAAMEVREKIDLIKEALPRDAWDPIVLKYNPFQMEAVVLSVSYVNQETDQTKLADLRQFCKKYIKDELERLDGVAKVEIRGGEKKEVLVEINKGRLLANQVSILEIINSIRDSNVTYPAGTISEDQYEYLVKTVGEFQTINDVANLSFPKDESRYENRQRTYRNFKGEAPAPKKKIVYIRDVADVKESLKDITGYSRYNGKDNVSLAIYPQSGSNLVRISAAINKRMAELQKSFPEDIDVKVIYDQAEFIKSSLDNIYSNALQGAVLSFLILFVFLASVKAALIICTAIPVSILITAILMYFGDISINTMSLGGFAIGIGMVVDNANIVLENIFTYFHKNPKLDKKDIIYNGTKEVVGPIISGTATTIAIFLPFIFVTGTAGQLFKQLALTISYAMIASIFVALLLVPRLMMNLDFAKYAGEGQSKLLKYFVPMLRKILNIPGRKIVYILAAYMIFGIAIYSLLPKEFMPKVDERRFVLNMNMPPQTPLDITNEIAKRMESYILELPETKDESTTVGSTEQEGGAGTVSSLGTYQGRILVRLKDNGRSTKEIVAMLNDEIKKWNTPGLETEFITQQGMFGSQIGASSGITVEIKGKNLINISERAKEIKENLAKIPNIYGIKIEPADLVPELKLVVDREKASLFGFSTQDISAMALAAIKGYVATKLKQKEDEFDIRIRLRPEDRNTIEKVGELTVFSPWGMTIQLKQIGQINLVQTLPEIKRTEGERTYFVTADIKKGFGKAVGKVKQMINALPKMEDVSTSITGELLAMRESMKSSVFAIILGVIIIYMILASQFESLGQPLIVMVTVPLSIAGAFYTLGATFQSVNSIALLGLIMMIGMAVSAAILLIDRYNTILKIKPEIDPREMVIEATSEHLRPILMTSLTTIIDLIPLSLGIGQGAQAMQPMAITIIGGLTFVLVLTLFFIPAIYLMTKRQKPIAADTAGNITAHLHPQIKEKPNPLIADLKGWLTEKIGWIFHRIGFR